MLITDIFTNWFTVGHNNVLASLMDSLLFIHLTDLDRLLIADLLRLIQTDLLGLVLAHLARHGIADFDRHHDLHNLGDILVLLLGDIPADLLAHGVALLSVLVAGDLSVIADLLRNLPLHRVLDIVTLLPRHVPAAVNMNSVALLLRMGDTRSLRNLCALLFWNVPADINVDRIALLLCNRMALLARHWPAVVDQDGVALLLHPWCAGSAGNITTLEGWLVLIFLCDVAAALLNDGGAVFVSHILAVLLRLLGANLVLNSVAFSFLDGVADLCGDVLANVLVLLFTDLLGCSLALLCVDCSTHFLWNILALFLWDLDAFFIIDSVPM